MSHREPHPVRVLCLLVATYWGVDEEGGGYSILVSVLASSGAAVPAAVLLRLLQPQRADEQGHGAVSGHHPVGTILQKSILIPINLIIFMLVLKV